MADIEQLSGAKSSDSRRPPQDNIDSKKKKEIVQELNQLQIKFLALDRDKTAHRRRTEFRNLFSSLDEVEIKFTKERNKEKHELRQKIEKIRSNVSHFKRTLKDGKTGPSFVEKIKETLEEIEGSILSFKEKQKEIYEQLLKEERIVVQEVTAYERRIDAWLSTKFNQDHVTTQVANKSAESIAPPAVIAFEHFLQQTGGHSGGWEDYDHQTFIKIWIKYQGQKSVVDEAVPEIPTHTRDDIVQHVGWYTKYCTLLENKKKAISNWRKQKELEKAQVMSETTDTKRDGVTKLSSAKDKLKEKERRENLAKLEQWKKEQQTRKLEAEQKRLQEEKEKVKQIKKEKERQALVKSQLEDYTRRKEEERRQLELMEQIKISEEKERGRLANKQIHKFQLRDAQVLYNKQEHLAALAQEEALKQIRLDKLKETVVVNVSRDPARLLKLTSGWEERQKAGAVSESSGPLLSIPKRAIPSWRQGL